MAYLSPQVGVGGRALAAAAVLVIHTAAGAALVTGMDVRELKPIERRTLTGINLPPPPPQPRTVPNPTSEGVPGKLYRPGTASSAEPVPDAMSWIVPEQHEPETSVAGTPRSFRGMGTGCDDCGWWPENDWQYYERREPYLIELGGPGGSANVLLPRRPATPLNDPTTWVVPGEWPVDERYGADWVGYSLTVDRQGRVGECEIIRRSYSGTINAAVCELISPRARFEPAIDQTGLPVEGTYNGTVKWEFRDNSRPDVPEPARAREP